MAQSLTGGAVVNDVHRAALAVSRLEVPHVHDVRLVDVRVHVAVQQRRRVAELPGLGVGQRRVAHAVRRQRPAVGRAADPAERAAPRHQQRPRARVDARELGRQAPKGLVRRRLDARAAAAVTSARARAAWWHGARDECGRRAAGQARVVGRVADEAQAVERVEQRHAAADGAGQLQRAKLAL